MGENQGSWIKYNSPAIPDPKVLLLKRTNMKSIAIAIILTVFSLGEKASAIPPEELLQQLLQSTKEERQRILQELEFTPEEQEKLLPLLQLQAESLQELQEFQQQLDNVRAEQAQVQQELQELENERLNQFLDCQPQADQFSE
ncbi:hypothetical protein NX722_11900 [Endozoicomonas gorgoniicola]|uniref:Uncharacterized protein n=1 Tax=Endozoicomonas gorgoniicola TaxID=1234144 RepID=A0ABT3MVE3_9GAMM|nr:hypothetical protein [Endozoicomonas gorgoniicola]MCW7553328.1 hypothetical protein [Endozoicomonas gorgoniicola]